MKQYHKNPRQITEKQFGQLDATLRELGDLSGIVHDLNTDEIIGGNQRSRVFDINKCTVEIVEQFEQPDEQGTVALGFVVWRGKKYAYRQVRWDAKQCEKANIVANKAGGAWDMDTLANEFELDELLEWGFDKKELDLDLWAGDAPEEPKEIPPDRFEEVAKKWGTSEGQIWKLGNHRVLCGDSLDAANITRVLGSDTPALIIADPPYGVNIVAANGYVGGGEAYNIPFGGRKNAGFRGTDGASKPSKAVRGTDGAAHVVEVGKYPVIIGDEDTETAQKAVMQYCDLFPNAVQVWWGANYYSPVLPASQCWVVWNKETTGNFADCELAWTNQDKSAKLFTHKWNGMLRDSERERRWHPTQKPAALAAWVYTEFTEPGAVILDPFAGAGWSILGGEQSKRRVLAIEKSHEYIAVILERWATMTGGTPELLDCIS